MALSQLVTAQRGDRLAYSVISGAGTFLRQSFLSILCILWLSFNPCSSVKSVVSLSPNS